MKTHLLILSLIVLPIFVEAAEPFRDPFVVLRINGTEYKPDSDIPVRAGERLIIEAVLMGGRRDYCMYPETYANIGRTTVINSKGENGISFTIGGGDFTGLWKLTSEKASFTSSGALKITPQAGVSNMERTAIIEIPKHDYSKVYIRINSETNWHYTRRGPAGQHEETETYTGSSLFNFVIEAEEGVWYSSANIVAKGMENFTVRNQLDQVQSFYDLIEKNIMDKNYSAVDMHVNNLKNYVAEVKRAIDDAKKSNSDYECEIKFIGLPSDLPYRHLVTFNELSAKWREMYLIAQTNVTTINNELYNYRMGFSANVLRSVFKNYINWGTGIPTGWEDMLTLHDPSNVFGPLDLPRKFMGWYTDAMSDASILNNQVRAIRMYSELQKFYMERMTSALEENRKIRKLINDLQPTENYHKALETYFLSVSWAEWQKKI